MTSLPRSRFIIRGDVLDAHREAHAIVADAEAEAARLRARVADERHQVFEAARREGLRQGMAEAAAIAAEAAKAIDAFWREQEGELAELALAVAYRVIGRLPADEVLMRLASEAIAEHAADVHLTLRAAPEAAACLRNGLKDVASAGRVTVLADPAAAPGACTLTHKNGRSEFGLLAQFRAMMDGLRGGNPDAEPEL